jgi:hypothetical protein
MSLINRFRRRPGAVRLWLVAGLAVTATALAAAPSQASAATYEFQPLRMHVHDVEDGWPDYWDEPRMYYGGQVWADVVRQGSTVNMESLPRATFTGTGMQVDLRERDGGWYDNNNLGTVWIPATPGQELRAVFGGPGTWWYYELIYRVVQVS